MNGSVVTGTSSDLVAAISEHSGAFSGAFTITNSDYTIAELKTINNATSGNITLLNTGTALSGISSDITAAFAGTVTTHTGAVTITNNDYTVAELSAINAATTGNITLSSTNVALSGNSTDIAAAFAGTVTTHTGTVGITNNDYTLAELVAINNASTGTITLTTTDVALTGSGSDLAAALTATINYTGNVTVSGTDYTIAQLKTINDTTTGSITLSNTAVALSGDSTDIAAAFAGTVTTHTGTVTITNNDYTVAELKSINDSTNGAITLNSPNVNISGTSSDLVSALAGTVTDHTGVITITNSDYTVAQLKTINAANSGSIVLSDPNVALTGTAEDIAAALAGTITKHTGTVTLTDLTENLSGTSSDLAAAFAGTVTEQSGTITITNNNYTVAELKTINSATTGSIILNDPSGALSGTSSDIAAALAGTITTHTGTVAVTNANYTLAELVTINNGSTGTITLSTRDTALTGSGSDLAAALAATINYTGAVTVSGSDYTAAQLKTINDTTSGTITLSTPGVNLSGTVAQLKAGFAGTVTTHTGTITITDAAATDITATDITTINSASNGAITVSNAIDINGSGSQVKAAFDVIDTNTGNATANITGNDYTVAQLKAINDATTGEIVLDNAGVALTGDSTDIAAAFAGTVTTHTGTVAVTNNDYTLAELVTINNASTGTITLTTQDKALTGSGSDLAAALAATINYTGAVTVSGSDYTAAQLKTINDTTSGTITLSTPGVNLSGTVAQLKAAFAGTVTTHTGTITITDAAATDITATDITTINSASNGAITVSNAIDINGTGAQVKAAFDAIDTNTGNATANITGNTYDVGELKDINNATSGAIVLADPSAALSGSSSDLAAAFAGTVTTHTGTVGISNSDYTLAELVVINNASSGAITLATTDVALTGTSSDLAAALAGSINHTGDVTITNDDYTLAQLKIINDSTSGSITIQNDASTSELTTINNASDGTIVLSDGTQSLTGTAAQIVEALAGTINYTGNVTITGTYTLAQLVTINSDTTGSITLNTTNVDLSGTSSDLAAAFAGTVTEHTGNIGITNADYTLAELVTINNASTGTITLTHTTPTTALSGTVADFAAGLAGTINHTGNVEITGSYTVAQLSSINSGTTGSITLNSPNVNLSGTVAQFTAAFAGDVTQHTGTIEITDAGTTDIQATDITTINNASNGAITVNNAIDINGTGAEVKAAFDAIDTNTGNATANITGTTYTIAELKAINRATTGAIVLADATAALSGTVADIKAAFHQTVTTHTGTLEITNANTADITATDITDINGTNTGTITVTNAIDINGSGSEVAAAFAAIDTNTGNATANVTGTDYTVAQLKTINDKGSGAIVLATPTANLSGDVADIVAAFAGSVTTNTGTIEITDANTTDIQATDIATINTAITGAITVTNTIDINGSGSDVAAAFTAIDTNTGNATANVTGTDYTVAQLKTINDKGSGAIVLATPTATLSGTVSDIKAAFAGTVTTNTGAVTISDANTTDIQATDIATINTAITGAITVTNAIDINGSGSDVAAAFTAIDTNTGNATANVTGTDYTVAQLKTINDKGSGAIVLAAPTATLSGTVADIVAAFAGTVTTNTGAVTISDANTTDIQATDIATINTAITGAITVTNTIDINGSGSDVAAAFTAIDTNTGNATANVTGTDYTVAQLKTINDATTGAIVLADASVNLSGDSTDIAAAFAGTVTTHTGSVTITNNDYTVTELKTINDATNGAIVLNQAGGALSGDSTDIAAALAGTITTHTGSVTITNNDYTLDELVAINNKTNGSITLNTDDAAISGDSSDYAAALAGTINYAGNVTISNANYTVAELANINNGTTGSITLSTNNTPLSGNSTDLAAALAGTINYAGNVTVTNNDYTIAELKAINLGTAGSITLSLPTANLSGNVADIVAAFAGSVTTNTGTIEITDGNTTDIQATDIATINTAITGAITVTNTIDINGSGSDVAAAFTAIDTNTGNATANVTGTDYTVAQLKTINDATTGAIVLATPTATLSGTVADIVAAFAGTVTTNTGAVTITDPDETDITATDITTINTAISGAITVTNAIDINGSGSDVATAVGHLDTLSGTPTANITGTDYTVAQLKTINDAIGGALVLENSGVNLSGTVAQFKAAFNETVTTHTGTITISDGATTDITATDITAINTASTGAITVSSAIDINGSGSEVAAAFTAIDTNTGNATAHITGTDYTVAHLKTINNATTGAIVLADASAALSGNSTDLAAALAGTVTTHTGTVGITNNDYTLAELVAINNASSGTITLTTTDKDLSGSGADLAAALAGTINYAGNVTVSDSSYTVAQLKAINNGTSGTITLTNDDVNLSGEAADIVAAFAGTVTTHTGDVTISDANTTDVNATDITTINTASTGNITVSHNIDINGSGSQVATAVGQIDTISGSPTANITGSDYTVTHLVTINGAISGNIVLANAGVALSGTVSQFKSAFAGTVTTHTGTVEITDAATTDITATHITDINGTNTGTITVTNAIDINGSGSEVAAAFTAIDTNTGNATANVTGTDYTVAQLKTINDKGSGAIVLAAPTANLSGDVADIVAAFAGSVTTNTGTIEITDGNTTDIQATDIATINTAITGAITVTNTIDINGSGSDVAAAFTAIDTNTGNATANVTGTDYTAAQLKTINDATTGAIVLVDPSVGLSGDSTVIAAAFAGTVTTHTGTVGITNNDYTLAELITINNASTGAITLTTTNKALSGEAAEVAAALDGTINHTGTVEVTTNHNLSQLKSISSGTSGTITLNSYAVALSGSTADVKAALGGTFANPYTGIVTLSDAATTDITATDITTINSSTSGAITVSNAIDINGSGSQVKLAFDAIDTNTGNATANITGTDYTVAQLKAINNATAGEIVLAAPTANLSGDVADVKAAFAGTVTTNTGTLEITDGNTTDITATDITTINSAITGAITVTNTIDINGSGSEVAAAFAAIDTNTGNATANVTGTDYTVAQLKTINDKGSGAIVLAAPTANLTGSVSDTVDAFAGTVTTNTGTITFDDNAGVDITATDITSLNAKITGNITFSNAVDINGSGAQVKAAFDVIDSNGNATAHITGNDYTIAQLKAINNATSGSINLVVPNVDFTDSSSNLAAAFDGTINSSGTLTVNNANYTVAELVKINNGTSGSIVLNTDNAALSGDVADIKAAFAGTITTHTGTLEITDAATTNITATDITDINGTNTGTITVTNAIDINGSGSEVSAAFAAIDTNTGNATANVTGTDYTVAHLKAINDATDGAIVLADASVNLSGDSSDIVAAFAGTVTTHTGTVTITNNDYTVTELKAINSATNGSIILNTDNVALSGTVANIKAAFAGTVTTHTGTLEITDANTTDITATDITAINATNTGTITVTNTIDINGSGSEVAAAFTAIDTNTGNATANVTGTDYTVAQLKTINDKGSGAIVLAAPTANLTGSVSDTVDAFAGTVTTNTGTITFDDNAGVNITATDITNLNAKITGNITFSNAVDINGSGAQVKAAFDVIDSNGNATANITGTDYTIAHLKAINNATAGAIVLAAPTANLSGDVADIVAAFAGSVTTNTGTIEITDANTTDIQATDIATINTAITGAITVTNTIDINGSGSDVAAAFTAIDTNTGNATANVTGTDYTVAQLKTINDATTGAIVLATPTATLSGTVSDIKSAFAGTVTTNTGAVTISDANTTDIQATDITTINTAITGAITVTNTIDINGTGAEVKSAFDAIDTNTGNATAAITGNDYTVAQLKAINAKTSGAIVLGTPGVDFTDSSSNLAAAFDGTINSSGNLTVNNNNYTVAELVKINNGTSGNIVLNTDNVALSGDVADIKAAFAGTITTHTGTVEITDAATTNITATDITDINGTNTGAITVTNAIDINGSGSEVSAAFAAIDTNTGNATANITGTDYTIAHLKAINNATAGAIVLATPTANLSGNVADIVAAFAGSVTTNTGTIEITDANTTDIQATDIATINTAITGAITVTNTIDINGSGSDVAAAFTAIDTNTGNATANVTGTDYTVAQLKTINDATTGAIVLAAPTANLTGSVSDTVDAFAGTVTTNTGTITFDDNAGVDITATDITSLNAKITGNITFSNAVDINGSGAQVKAAFDVIDSNGNATANITGTDYTIAQLKAINNATAGAIVLAAPTANLSGDVADIVAAFAGSVTTNTGTIEITDGNTTDIQATDIATINTAITGAITVTNTIDINGSGSDVAAAFTAIDTNTGNATANVTGTDYTVAQLKTINDATTGAIVLADASVNLSGDSTDIAAAFAGTVTTHTGSVTITNNDYTVAELKTINDATNGAIVLNHAGVALSGSATDVAAALAGTITTHTGNVTLSGTTSVTDLSTVDGRTDGTITYSLSDTSGNISGASTSVLNGATNITATHDGAGGNIFEFDNLTSTTTTSSVTVTGDAGVDVVELSTALTQSGKASIALGDGDGAADDVIFNTEASNTDWVTFDSSGNRNGGPTSFSFNKITNWEAANDDFGIFYGGTNGDNGSAVTFGTFTEVTALNASMRLKDGIIYEDTFNSDGGLAYTNAYVSNISNIRANLDSIITAGGTSASSQASSDLDFTYILYAQSSADSTATSAYIYTGTYGVERADAGTAMTDTSLKIMGIAEIDNITSGALTSAQVISTKPGTLDQ